MREIIIIEGTEIEIISEKEISYLSLNILGGKFKEDHSNYKAKKNGFEPWKPYEPIFISEYINDYEKIECKCNIYFHANNIHNKNYPIDFKKDTFKIFKDEARKYLDQLPTKSNKGDKEVIYQVKLIHDPIKLNYWYLTSSPLRMP